MKKLYCVICGKYKKFKNPKISYIFEKALVSAKKKVKKYLFLIICSKCKKEGEKIFRAEEAIEILKIIGLIENISLL